MANDRQTCYTSTMNKAVEGVKETFKGILKIGSKAEGAAMLLATVFMLIGIIVDADLLLYFIATLLGIAGCWKVFDV